MRFPIENLFDEMFNGFGDDFFDDDFNPARAISAERGLSRPFAHGANLMRTDVTEHEKNYELAIELPGFKKDDIKVRLDNGFLTISAETKHEEEKHEDANGKPRKNGRIIRHERHYGSMSRSWYVGDDIKQEDVKANYKAGVLTLEIPKAEPKKELPEDQKYIAIEG